MTAFMTSKEEFVAESDELRDWAERVHRGGPDFRIYQPGEPRAAFPWWRRLLKL